MLHFVPSTEMGAPCSSAVRCFLAANSAFRPISCPDACLSGVAALPWRAGILPLLTRPRAASALLPLHPASFQEQNVQ